jgi:hypothetical protein
MRSAVRAGIPESRQQEAANLYESRLTVFGENVELELE